MSHPENEEWMSYLYDECNAAERRRLRSHLGSCPECRARVDAWRGTGRELDADHAVLARPTAPWAWRVWGRRALAAAALVAAGVLAGRMGTVTRAEMRRELEASQARWAAGLRLEQAATGRELAGTVEALAVRQAAWMDGLRREWATGRDEDRRAVGVALAGLEERHEVDTTAIQAGLLRLARETGSGFEQTQDRLDHLAGYTPTSGPGPGTGPGLRQP